MMTGDYPSTAGNIARQIGLSRSAGCVTGDEIRGMDDRTLLTEAARTDIFARVVPGQKLRLVTAFKGCGHVVAMTGDGVNDAPALKAADIGIAMGGRGTDVAREAASLVLLDDDFASIVRAVGLGRRIYDNIEKATGYVLAVHVPIAGVTLVPVLLGWPLVLLPVHVILLELIIDPACSIAFEMEREEPNVMRRPPRDPATRLFTRHMVTRSVLQGLGALVATLAVLVAARDAGLSEPEVRTVTFATLILANLALIFTHRSLSESLFVSHSQPNRALRWITGGAIALLALVLYVPALRDWLRLAPVHANDVVAIVFAAACALAWMEGVKLVTARARGA
jgi:Ca2+-transporting ATPase